VKDPIEDALEKMKPAEMPDALMARLTAARPQPKERSASVWRRWLLPLATAGCAAAAALAILKHTENPPTPVTVATAEPLPFERNDYLVGVRDVGLMVAPNQRPYRVMEVEWLESNTVRANERGPAIRFDTKRRDVVPVALEIF
jgi:hypothetical protein